MNREIKFRAWDKRFNIMADVLELGIGFGANASYNAYDGEPCKPDLCREDILELKEREGLKVHIGTLAYDFVIMQYTGLRDCEGKEIYDGDILEYLPYRNLKNHEPRKIGCVEWGETGDSDGYYYGRHLEWVIGDGGLADVHGENCKIIGNVFENPELLEVRNEEKMDRNTMQ